MRALLKNISLFMIVVFAAFYCGNTVFIHSHLYQGHRITHSHPYLPGDHHSHNAVQILFIAEGNTTAYSVLPAHNIFVPDLVARLQNIVAEAPEHALENVEKLTHQQRGPPAAASFV